jgi:two-component system, sensor histidine kinase PdtaS
MSMATARARSTAFLTPEANRETTLKARSPPTAEPSRRPMNGLLALSEHPAGVVAVSTLSTVLSRISGSTSVCFGHYLRDLCDDLAGTFGGPSGPGLTCAAADAALPVGTAVTLRLVADLLITNAFVHAFPPGMPGWVAVSFTLRPEGWELGVEDMGIALRPHGDRRDNGLMIARLLVLRLDGRLEIRRVNAGTRCLVTVPRLAGGLDGTRSKAALAC